MPIVIAYASEAALNPRLDRAAPAIRTVAAQVRRQIPLVPGEIALSLPPYRSEWALSGGFLGIGSGAQ